MAEAAAPSSGTSKGTGKGCGKGNGAKGPPGPPPPRDPNAKPKAKATPPPKIANASGKTGMAELLSKVADRGVVMDRDNALDIEGVDMSGIDADAKGETMKCPRCEKEVLVSFYDSHKNSHSAEILSWLFLGGGRNADNGKELTVRTQITHILNVAAELNQDRDAKQEWQDYAKEKGIPCEYLKIEWTDTAQQDIIKEMEGMIDFIRAAHTASPDNHVLVHCVQGISRSASVILYYLMLDEKMTLREAFDLLKERRPIAEPRPEFLDQLGAYECRLNGLDKPTLTTAEVYEGKIRLNVD
jgi:predicted protein tyrosine phosphatase